MNGNPQSQREKNVTKYLILDLFRTKPALLKEQVMATWLDILSPISIYWLIFYFCYFFRSALISPPRSVQSNSTSSEKNEENWVNSGVRLEYIVTHSFSTGAAGASPALKGARYIGDVSAFIQDARTHTHTQSNQPLKKKKTFPFLQPLV